MRMYIITAYVLGERVTLYHQPSSQMMVDEWFEKNLERLTEKGFSGFETDTYYMDEGESY